MSVGRTVTIQVTAEHIAKAREEIATGVEYRSRCCPVAQACKLPGLTNPTISSMSAHWDETVSIPLPVEARRFVLDFDAGAYVEPFAFELTIPGAAP